MCDGGGCGDGGGGGSLLNRSHMASLDFRFAAGRDDFMVK